MLKKVLTIIIMTTFLISSLHSEEEIIKKVVYDLKTGDLKQFEDRLISGIIRHTTYYQNRLQELDVKVIVHGDAYKFFMKDLNNTAYIFQPDLVSAKPNLQKRLSSLSEQYGVTFLICNIGVKNRKLHPKAFYPFVSMVHNAAIGLIDAQNDGYAYLPLH